MSVLSSSTITEIQAKIVEYETLLDTAMDSYAAAMASANKSYKFDSQEGMQQVVKRSLLEMRQEIEWLEARIDHLSRRLSGGLNCNLNVRRKSGRGLRRRGGTY